MLDSCFSTLTKSLDMDPLDVLAWPNYQSSSTLTIELTNEQESIHKPQEVMSSKKQIQFLLYRIE